MRHTHVRVGLTSLVLVLAFAGLFYSSLSESADYYKHVDEVMVNPEAWHGKPLQIHGFVVSKSIVRKRDALEYRFDVESNGHVVRAMYTGIVPDTFKDEAEVVLKGTLGPEGFQVRPDGIMAKCPSKYEPRPSSPEAADTPSDEVTVPSLTSQDS
jgi:cytochrome c-type biogenesis protein CcmE